MSKAAEGQELACRRHCLRGRPSSRPNRSSAANGESGPIPDQRGL